MIAPVVPSLEPGNFGVSNNILVPLKLAKKTSKRGAGVTEMIVAGAGIFGKERAMH
jgi:hypothetical protein